MTLQEIKDQYAQMCFCEPGDEFIQGFSAAEMEHHMNEVARRYAQSKVEEAKTHISDVLNHMGLSIIAKEVKNNPLPLKFD